MDRWDIAIVGAGTAGIPAFVEAAGAGARVVLLEQSDRVGGTLHVSAGQMSGAGTGLQRERGIVDSVEAHVADAMRISRGTSDEALVRKAAALAGETVDWLMSLGFDMDPSCPAILHLHEAYQVARTYWGRDGGRSVLRVLLPLLERAERLPNAAVRMRTAVTGLRVAADGAVCGLTVRDGASGRVEEIAADAVILATGGYAGNRALFAQLTQGTALFTPALPGSTGAGIMMAQASGALVRGAEHFIPTFAGIEEEPGTGTVVWEHLPSLTPQVRPPWEIFVGRDGRRFVCEDIESVDARERALMTQPDLTFWAVFDRAIEAAAPPLLPGWSPAALAKAWAGHPSFAEGETLAALAARAGIDAAGLRATVAEYNAGQATGEADRFGRRHRPLPIAQGPFRAIRMHGIVLKTPAGLAVDEALRVLRPDGAPIAGLYAIGEAIGGAALSGNSFVSGMSVTPALSFGRWLGRTLGARCRREAA